MFNLDNLQILKFKSKSLSFINCKFIYKNSIQSFWCFFFLPHLLMTQVVTNLFILEDHIYPTPLLIKPMQYNIHYNYPKSNDHKFVNLLTKNGLKIKYIKMYTYLFKTFYDSFYYYNNYFADLFPLYNTFYNLSKSNAIFYVINYFYHLLFSQYNFIFFIKVTEIPKKLKKRKNINSKYDLQISYLKSRNRAKWILKQIILHSVVFTFQKYQNKIHNSFVSVLLTPELNFLKEQQLKIYKILMATKKSAA